MSEPSEHLEESTLLVLLLGTPTVSVFYTIK
jgi:hypothetical protein